MLYQPMLMATHQLKEYNQKKLGEEDLETLWGAGSIKSKESAVLPPVPRVDDPVIERSLAHPPRRR